MVFIPQKDFIETLVDKLPSLPRAKQIQELQMLYAMGAERLYHEFKRYENDLALRNQVQEITK